MAKKTRARGKAGRSTAVLKTQKSSGAKRGKSARKSARRMAVAPRGGLKDPLLAPVRGADHREVGHVALDVGRAGAHASSG
jgi:hypothetical protein